MIKNPIQAVTDKLQFRAIGIIQGIYNPHDKEKLNRGFITDDQGNILDAVVLGKSLSLIKKHLNLDKNYFWIVYPRNKNINNLHLQIAGIWAPYELNNFPKEDSNKQDPIKLLEEMNLNDNYFSIRGELVYVNSKKKEFVVKIYTSAFSKKLKNNYFKLILEGEIPLEFLNQFVSLDVKRKGNTLIMEKFEVFKKILSKNK